MDLRLFPFKLMTVATQGATGSQRIPAKLVTCCSRCGLLSWWFMYVVLLLAATRVSCFTFHLTSWALIPRWACGERRSSQ